MKLKSIYYSIEFLQMENVFDDVADLLQEDKCDPVMKILYKISTLSEKKFIEKMSVDQTLRFLVVETGILLENNSNYKGGN